MWTSSEFDALSTKELYEILELRVNVFVVEQTCPYPELDGMDYDAIHIQYREHGKLLAYCRVLPPGKYAEPSIGRVIVEESKRGSGLANDLMIRAVEETENRYKESSIRLCAQAHLQSFYRRFGFETVSEEFLEDGIPHVYMIRN
ncbi:GNAT family N-acetyltransferase [Chryseomicrobium palamuruense]|uniref:GNAT family N-acetyltransferase n=1 Tax=Chryseomicrobium palamuruense TaxID=682973 RepID=A0ABV8UWG9_9BACL